jgi:hypothetical protein
MKDLGPAVLAGLWTAYRSGRAVTDPDLAPLQKFMVLHQDMHEHWDRLVADPSTSLVVDGEPLALHIAMDAATEQALERNEPPGLQVIFASLTKGGFDEGSAFHVISQAMLHEFISEAEAGREMNLGGFFRRAADYARQAMEQRERS